MINEKTVCEVDLGNERYFLVKIADLLSADADAIVNAANGHLAHGGGVAAVIEKAAGPELTKEGNEIIRSRGIIPTGEAVITTAGKLPFKGVIHTVGPKWGDGNELELLIRAMKSAFLRAHEKNWNSVAFPAVSSGIFAVPLEICAKAYVRSIKEFLNEHPETSIKRFILCLRPGSMEEYIKSAIKELEKVKN